jgi:hypothetical protein
MPVILPLMVFVSVWATFYGLPAGKRNADWRQAFLQAALVCGALVVAFSEGLGAFGALSGRPLALLWILSLACVLIVGWRIRAFSQAWASLREVPWRWPSVADVLLLSSLAAIVLVLLGVGVVSPPNNTDSLQYHMSRVMHWAQSQSLRHYPTAYEVQLSHPIWAELAILNLRLLLGTDRLANLVQWSALIGSLVAASALAAALGVPRRGQLLAICFAVSIPAGLLEATSTQNDLVVAFWAVSLAYFVLQARRRDLDRLEWLSLSLALGLGLLTKATFYPLAVPILLWLFLPKLLRPGRIRVLRQAAFVAAVVVLLNLGYWVRNLATFGTPLGSIQGIEGQVGAHLAPNAMLASWVRNVALNFPTPSETLNGKIVGAILNLHRILGADPEGFSMIWAWNNENLAGNPLHVGLTVVAFGLLFALRRKGESSLPQQYALVALVSILALFSVTRFDVYGVRHQLVFLVLWGPIVGLVATRLGRPSMTATVAGMLLLASLPWLLLNGSRPVVGLQPRTMIDSVFREPPAAVLFANWTALRGPYSEAAAAIQAAGCREVGLRIDSADLEYPFWWLLDAPQSGIRIETMDAYPHLERYVDANFRPCAILCTVCGGRTRLHGLERSGTFGPIALYLGSTYSPGEDD